jgi:hypothetical protein
LRSRRHERRSTGALAAACARARPVNVVLGAAAFFVFGMNVLRPIFAAAFPELDRPMFTQDSFSR